MVHLNETSEQVIYSNESDFLWFIFQLGDGKQNVTTFVSLNYLNKYYNTEYCSKNNTNASLNKSVNWFWELVHLNEMPEQAIH